MPRLFHLEGPFSTHLMLAVHARSCPMRRDQSVPYTATSRTLALYFADHVGQLGEPQRDVAALWPACPPASNDPIASPLAVCGVLELGDVADVQLDGARACRSWPSAP